MGQLSLDGGLSLLREGSRLFVRETLQKQDCIVSLGYTSPRTVNSIQCAAGCGLEIFCCRARALELWGRIAWRSTWKRNLRISDVSLTLSAWPGSIPFLYGSISKPSRVGRRSGQPSMAWERPISTFRRFALWAFQLYRSRSKRIWKDGI